MTNEFYDVCIDKCCLYFQWQLFLSGDEQIVRYGENLRFGSQQLYILAPAPVECVKLMLICDHTT